MLFPMLFAKYVLLLVPCLFVGSSASCLPNGTAAAERKDLVNLVAGESYAIGLWPNGDYPAARIVSRVVQIVLEEKIGYNVELKGPGALTIDGFYALMGCTTPLDGTNRGCSESSVTKVHISVEVWTEGYADAWSQIQEEYPKKAPKNIGNMGYSGTTSMYIPSAVQERAYDVEGINLDFYRDYNGSRQNPGAYFTSPGDVNVSYLWPCVNTSLMSNSLISSYLTLTGDSAGVDSAVVDNKTILSGKCFDTYFWYAPACRATPSTCLTWFTGGTGWGLLEIMLKAAGYNMPLATSVGSSWGNYVSLPSSNNFMVYWWVPDPTFLRLKPQRVIFPPHDADGWSNNDQRTASKDISVDKHVSQDLSVLAPEVEEFMHSFQVSMAAVDAMMLDQLDTSDTDYDVACRWLQTNEERVTGWLPEKGKCFSQFGMYSETEQKFLETRSATTITCRACPSGFYSSRLEDGEGTSGVTHICLECPSGSFQASGASVSCNPCPAGSYQNATGSVGCNRCPVGQYQDEEGQRQCKPCPTGATTLLLGSNSLFDCGCMSGSIDIGNETLECTECGEGLECPFSSSIKSLKSGEPLPGEQLVTRIQSGYFAPETEPFKIFRCRPESWCPGGIPGNCAGGMAGAPCAFCPEGKSLSDGKCEDCGASVVAWVAAILIGLGACGLAYFFVNMTVRAQATPFKNCQMAVGLAVNALQSLALLGLMSAKWPTTFQKTSSSLQIFVLDLDSWGVACMIGGTSESSYILQALVFPFCIMWLLICHVVSQVPCRCKAWKLPFTLNTIGLGLQLGFGTIAAVALKPMMCYQHPNGSFSVLSYPSVFCGEGGHGLMLAFGIVLLALFVMGFLVICSFAVLNLPRWSMKGEVMKVQSFRFCTSNFRFDSYGFIVPLLCRGLGFAAAVAVGTNSPPVQTALTTIVLASYTVIQASSRPWKSPIINVADTLLSSFLLILASRSIQQDSEMEAEFGEYFTVLLLLLLLLCLLSLLVMCGVGFALQLTGRNWNAFLSLGGHNTTQVTEALKHCSELLMHFEEESLRNKIAAMNTYDVKTVATMIDIIGDFEEDEIRTSRIIRTSASSLKSPSSRVRLQALNADLEKQRMGRSASVRTNTSKNSFGSFGSFRGGSNRSGGSAVSQPVEEVKEKTAEVKNDPKDDNSDQGDNAPAVKSALL